MKLNFHKINSFFSSIDDLMVIGSAQEYRAGVNMDHTNINDYVCHWQSKWFEATIDKWKLGRVIMAYIFVNNMWALWKMRESFGRILKYSSNFLPHFWKTQCPHNPCSLCLWSYLTDTRQAWGGKVREEMDESLRPVK